MSYFPHLRVPRRAAPILWRNGRWVSGSIGRRYVFLVYFSKTTRHITLIIFGPPRKCFKVSVVKKLEKKNKNKFFKKFRTKRTNFAKKVLRNPLYFDRFWWFRFFEHWFVNFSKTTWDFFLIVSRIFRKVFMTSFEKNLKNKKFKIFQKISINSIFGVFFVYFQFKGNSL